MSFSIIRRDEGTVRVAVDGSLDYITIELLRGQLSIALAIQPLQIDLDLSSLRFVDNDGLGLLLSFVKRVDAHGGACVTSNGELLCIRRRDARDLRRRAF